MVGCPQNSAFAALWPPFAVLSVYLECTLESFILARQTIFRRTARGQAHAHKQHKKKRLELPTPERKPLKTARVFALRLPYIQRG